MGQIIIQDIHKRMVPFQKLTRNLFLNLHGHNVHRQQHQLSKFLTRYLPAVRFSCLLRGRGASFQDGVAAGKVFLCAPFEVSRSERCTKLTLYCNHRSGHLKTEHTQSLFLMRRHLGNWSRGPAVSMRSKLLVAHEKLGQLLLMTV